MATTLVNPNFVRHHKQLGNQFIYYIIFETIKMGNREIESKAKHWAVVIDVITCRVCTVYPTFKPKTGKEYTGGGVR